VGRDYDPVAGQWFEDLDEEELFLVLAVDPDEELVKIQYENGDIEEIDLDTWHVLDLEKTTQPEGWSGSVAPDDEEEEELDDDEDDEDDDWDEDDDDDDLDDDDDEYDDRA
jgi:hypothetical protein